MYSHFLPAALVLPAMLAACATPSADPVASPQRADIPPAAVQAETLGGEIDLDLALCVGEALESNAERRVLARRKAGRAAFVRGVRLQNRAEAAQETAEQASQAAHTSRQAQAAKSGRPKARASITSGQHAAYAVQASRTADRYTLAAAGPEQKAKPTGDIVDYWQLSRLYIQEIESLIRAERDPQHGAAVRDAARAVRHAAEQHPDLDQIYRDDFVALHQQPPRECLPANHAR